MILPLGVDRITNALPFVLTIALRVGLLLPPVAWFAAVQRTHIRNFAVSMRLSRFLDVERRKNTESLTVTLTALSLDRVPKIAKIRELT